MSWVQLLSHYWVYYYIITDNNQYLLIEMVLIKTHLWPITENEKHLCRGLTFEMYSWNSIPELCNIWEEKTLIVIIIIIIIIIILYIIIIVKLIITILIIVKVRVLQTITILLSVWKSHSVIEPRLIKNMWAELSYTVMDAAREED